MILCVFIKKIYKLNYMYLYKNFKFYLKIMFRLTCFIIAHVLDIDERFNFFRTIQTPIYNFNEYNNINNI
jgi:hypothetical protein